MPPLALNGPYHLRILQAGPMKVVPHSTGAVGRPFCTYLLNVSRAPGCEIEVDGVRHELPPEAVWLIQPGQMVSARYRRFGRLDWLHFTVKPLPSTCPLLEWTNFGLGHPSRDKWLQPRARAVWGVDLPVVAPASIADLLIRGVEEVVQLWLEGSDLARCEAQQRLGTLLLRWAREQWTASAPPRKDPCSRLARAEHFARMRLGSAIGASDLADAAGLERTYFSTLYRKHRGETPAAFLRRLRLEHAALMLRTQEIPVRVVAQSVGYPDAAAFTRAFKALYGCAPSAYRAAGG